MTSCEREFPVRCSMSPERGLGELLASKNWTNSVKNEHAEKNNPCNIHKTVKLCISVTSLVECLKW